MFDRILVPVDGSAPSNAGVDLALEIARVEGGRLTFCSVREPLPPDVGSIPEQLRHAGADEVESWWSDRVLREATERAEHAGVTSTVLHVNGDGDVVQAILGAAEQENASLIVMGTHGRGGLERALVGSKTEGVLRRSRVPVFVAPRAA